MIRLPKGFTPVSLEKLLSMFADSSLAALMWAHFELPAEEAMARIQALEAKSLVTFAIAPGGAPSAFIAPSTAEFNPYEKPEDFALAEKIIAFWDVQGKFDAAHGELVSADRMAESEAIIHIQTPDGPMSVVARVASRMFRMGLIEKDKLGSFHAKPGAFGDNIKEELMKWTATNGICDFCADPSPKHIEDVPDFEMPDGNNSVSGWATCDLCHQMVARDRRDDLLRRALKHSMGGKLTEFALRDLHKRFWKAWDRKHAMKVEGFGPAPHWQVALDRKANAIREVQFIEKIPPYSKFGAQISWMDLKDDLDALRIAEVYSFSAETMHAIMTAAESIPHESNLRSVELPSAKAGWFWFAQPYPVTSSPIASDVTAALLWSWDMHDRPSHKDSGVPRLRFSAYVWDAERQTMNPSTKWLWPLDMSFHDMLQLNAQLYINSYGPAGPFKDQKFLQGQERTLQVVAALSLFFMMACLWFRQTVPGTKKKIEPKLTQESGHIERHARKRYEREFKATPTVRVIALRKSARTVDPSEPHEVGEHHLKVRFIVQGHARLQPCGPGRTDRKLIWIEPFIKGPDDAPFKESGPKVFAVVR